MRISPEMKKINILTSRFQPFERQEFAEDDEMPYFKTSNQTKENNIHIDEFSLIV